MLVKLEERWQVDDVLLCQAQLLLEDVPVPVNAALEGEEKKGLGGRAGKQGSPKWPCGHSHAGGEHAKMQHLL